MSNVEAVADVMLGGVIAGTIEPGTGAIGADGHSHERECLNCGTALVGDYCHACGQRGHIHRTIGAFFHDLLHGVFHFEGKIWTTLPRLAWRPGELTRDYIEGKRASFVSPLALFLFVVFLMFAVVSSANSPITLNNDKAKAGLTAEYEKAAADTRSVAAERASALAAGKPTAALDQRLAKAREEERLLKTIADRGFLRGSAVRVSDDVPDWLAGPLKHAAENPELILYKVKNNAYKYSWALIPLSLPFVWLLFPFSRRFRLYDHVVFVTYSLSFMTLLVVVASLLAALGLKALAGLTMIVPPLHMYRQLKAAYDLTWFGALWRTMLLNFFAVVTVGLFIAALFALGIF